MYWLDIDDIVTQVIKSHRLFKFIGLFLNLMTISMSVILVVFPPVGTIIGFLLVLVSFMWTLFLFRIRLIVDDTSLTIRSLRSIKKVKFAEIQSLEKMKVIGTVANSPILVRSFTLRLLDGKMHMIRTYWYRLNDVLDVIELIEKRREIVK